MARAGYVPLSQSWAEGGTNATSVLFLGSLGFLVHDGGRLTATRVYRPHLTGPPTTRLRTAL